MQQARVIIIGGGIVGVSTLYHLAKAGCPDALLLERKELTSGATWHAAGNVHTQSAFPNLSALQAYSLRLYDGLAEEVGQEVGSHVVGGFFLAQNQQRMQEFKFLAGKFRALDIEYDIVTPQEIAAKHPLVNIDDLVGGAWDPEEGYVDPYSVTMGLAMGARQMGATIKRNTRANKIERKATGHWRIETDTDEIYECEIIVNAAGFWANDVAKMIGARLPITNMEHQYIVTDSLQEIEQFDGELPMIRDTDSQYYMRQEGDGLLFGPWEKSCKAAWDNTPAPWDFGQELFANNLDRLEEGLEAIYHRIPALEKAGIKRIINGAISFAPDARPMIGPLPGVPGFFVACGFLGGIAQAGGIGLVMSQWILEGEPEMDLSFIDVARFGNWASKEFARERTFEVYPQRYEIIYPHQERNTGRNIRTNPVFPELLKRGAVMGQAYGWERPLWFAPEGIEAKDKPSFSRPNWWQYVGNECRDIAEKVGLIDMTSYAKFIIQGRDAKKFLNHIGSANVPIVDGQIALSLLLNERGGILGDITLCRISRDSYYLVGATLAEGIYHRWMVTRSEGYEVSVSLVTPHYGVFGVMGPYARELLQSLSEQDFSTGEFPYMTMREVDIGSVRCRALRISYSGELGWELHCPMENLLSLFNNLMKNGADYGLSLVGSRALGSLRLEKGYRSWGAELTSEITPREARLEFLCSKQKNYIGRSAVDKHRGMLPERRLITLEIKTEQSDCWGSEPIFHNNQRVGHVTSGGYGWRINKSLAVGLIESRYTEPGTGLQVQILGEKRDAEVVQDPAYDRLNFRLRG